MQEDLHRETGEEKMKCPICGLLLRKFGTTCHHKERDFIKEIERLKKEIEEFENVCEKELCRG